MNIAHGNAFCLVLFVSLLMLGCGKPDSQNANQPAEAMDSDPAVEAVAPDTLESGTPDPSATSTDTSATTGDSAMNTSTNFYEISTRYGKMVVRLYDETPQHRDNFRKLVAEGYYDGTTFHRVIEGFMIQGGDGNSKDDDPYNDGTGGPGYTVEAEFSPDLFHKKGALAAARQPDQVNPDRRSSGSQFYIVQGSPLAPEQLADMKAQLQQRDPNFSISPEAEQAYVKEGGTPFLDGQYTVFGELVEGFDVLDAIAATATARKTGESVSGALTDRPFEDIPMTIRPLADYAVQ
ncbi:MAG: peptidylprolyl isomerase [Rhodothermales bacterium]|nr:peptidylprolyl isomerase [Rhodothermales bacterium]